MHNLSNIDVQLFEYASKYLRVFRAIHEANTHLRTRRHELIPTSQLLTVLQKTPRPSLGTDIEISEEDCAVYRFLEEGASSRAEIGRKSMMFCPQPKSVLNLDRTRVKMSGPKFLKNGGFRIRPQGGPGAGGT